MTAEIDSRADRHTRRAGMFYLLYGRDAATCHTAERRNSAVIVMRGFITQNTDIVHVCLKAMNTTVIIWPRYMCYRIIFGHANVCMQDFFEFNCESRSSSVESQRCPLMLYMAPGDIDR